MHIKVRNVNDAFATLVRGFADKTLPVRHVHSRYGDVIKVDEPVMITYNHPTERVLFNPYRSANCFFHLYESLWLLAGRNDVEPLAYYNSKMREFSDNGETYNAAYGYRWRTATVSNLEGRGKLAWHGQHGGVDQIDFIVKHLTANPESRRAVLSMWSVEDDLLNVGESICPTCKGDWSLEKALKIDEAPPPALCPNCNGYPERPFIADQGSKDIACNLCVKFSIRERRGPSQIGLLTPALDMTVFNRSNDSIWGALGANVVQFSVLLEYMAARLNLFVGRYNHVTDDLHVYKNNFNPELWLRAYAGQGFKGDRGYYDVLKPNLVPLIKDPQTFEKELPDFVEMNYNGPTQVGAHWVWQEPFLQTVAQPMCHAFHSYKNFNYSTAKSWAESIADDAWRTVAEEWLQSRIEKKVKT